VTHFRPEVQARAQGIARLGSVFAYAVSQPIFFALNDKKISKFLGFPEPIMDHKSYFVMMSLLILLSGIFIQFFIKEKVVKRTKITKNLMTTCSYLRKFFSNKVLKDFSLYLLLQKLGFAAFQFLFINQILLLPDTQLYIISIYTFLLFIFGIPIYIYAGRVVKF